MESARLPVGIVIPVYNRARRLQATLSSVLTQTRPPTRLVVVDDGSTDGSADAAQQWLEDAVPPFEWVVVRAPHRHAAAARNTGLERVQDLDYVIFLDSDDCWPDDFLARTCALLEETAAAALKTVAVSADRAVDGPDSRHVNPDLSGLPADPELWMVEHDAGLASCTVFSRQAVEAAGKWAEGVEAGEDFMLFSSVARLGTWLHSPGKPVRFNRRVANARGQKGNLSRSLPTKHWEWANLAQGLLEETDDSDAARKERLQQAVAQRWVSAGNHLVRKRLFGLASKAYRRAMALGQASPSVRARAAVSGLMRPLGKRAPKYERAG